MPFLLNVITPGEICGESIYCSHRPLSYFIFSISFQMVSEIVNK